MFNVAPVLAGTDLTVNCAVAGGGCDLLPAPGTPLFNETNILPGDSFVQTVTAINSGSDNGYFAFEALNLANTGSGVSLSDVITIEVRQGSAVGPVVYGPISLTNMYQPDPNYVVLSQLNAGNSQDYYFIATFDVMAGNEYQNLASVFDLRLGFELIPSGGSGSNGGDGGGGSNSGGTSQATPTPCNADVPTSAPSLSIVSTGVNTVSLSWTPVSPVTHYALVFTRNSDGEQYGSPNIGNVTSYTVTNLSGGANYTFQVFGVNDCAPGPRSNQAGSGLIAGSIITSRPIGSDGDVLGVETETPVAESEETGILGAVEGVTSEVCTTWRLYIPWILLIAQAVFIFINEYYFRRKRTNTKHFLTLGITLASIAIFYLVRECNCYGDWSWLVWLCRWYWLVSAIISVVLRFFSYAFVEEITDHSSSKTDSTSNPTK